MADIFISYSAEERPTTERLARWLEGKGYSVWWDKKILSGRQYEKVIRLELDKSKAAIVIWTPTSVQSDFVYSEATRAADAGKLITLRVREVAIADIPLPFGARQTAYVDQFKELLEAIIDLGVKPRAASRRREKPGTVGTKMPPVGNHRPPGELIWAPQLRELYETHGIVKFGDVVIILSQPKITTSQSAGTAGATMKGLVRRKQSSDGAT
jgi:hypothetical protein